MQMLSGFSGFTVEIISYNRLKSFSMRMKFPPSSHLSRFKITHLQCKKKSHQGSYSYIWCSDDLEQASISLGMMTEMNLV